MKTLEEKKQFALEQIGPYYKNPNSCGYIHNKCKNLTSEGKMCVVGKNLIEEVRIKHDSSSYIELLHLFDLNRGYELNYENQDLLLIPESRNILINNQWGLLQSIHDYIAKGNVEKYKLLIYRLDLFTFEELEDYCNTLN